MHNSAQAFLQGPERRLASAENKIPRQTLESVEDFLHFFGCIEGCYGFRESFSVRKAKIFLRASLEKITSMSLTN